MMVKMPDTNNKYQKEAYHYLKDYTSFIKAGKAIFTLENKNSGNRFTYKVKKLKDKDIWFVSVLNGPDNYHNYHYLGTIFGQEFRATGKSRISVDALSHKAFKWLNSMLNVNKPMPDGVYIYHEGRCGRCGKRLTVPSSILSGFGPECVKKQNILLDEHFEI
jgi:hypothetical protein